ncbi:MAG: hypothetical protein ACM31C_12850 [Acidobacteriota bacterium]
MKAIALVASLTLVAGCFGYNSSAKKWAYVGNTVLIAGGGGAIGWDLATRPGMCTGNNCPYQAPVGGGVVAGAVLVTAGLIGIIYNATRPEVKTSR